MTATSGHTPRSRRAFGAWGAAGILAVVLSLYFSCWPIIRSDLPIHHTDAWPSFHDPRFTAGRYSPHVRLSDASRRELLMRIPAELMLDDPAPYIGVTYRFEIPTQKLSKAAERDWDQAAGAIVDCNRQGSAHRLQPFSWSSVDYKLYRREGTLETAGEYAVGSGSPREADYIAVFSANGPRTSIGGLGWGSGASFGGQHYHQTYSVERAGFVGPAVRLPFTTREIYWVPCLVEDRLALYLANSRNLLVAVPLELE